LFQHTLTPVVHSRAGYVSSQASLSQLPAQYQFSVSITFKQSGWMSGANNNFYALEPTLYNPDEEPVFPVDRERLDEFVPTRSEPEDPAALPILRSHDPYGKGGDPGIQAIVEILAPNVTDLHVPHQLGFRSEDIADRDTVMNDQGEGQEATETPDISPKAEPSAISPQTGFEAKLKDAADHGVVGGFNRKELQAKATASLREHDEVTQSDEPGKENGLEKRHDSHQEQEITWSPGADQGNNPKESSSLALDTKQAPKVEESIAHSPTLSKHVIMDSDRPETLPAFQHHSHGGDSSATSPQSASLPPIYQVVPAQRYRPLNELAEVCTQNDPRNANHSSPPLSSTVTLSPGIPYQLYSGSTQTSPSSQHTFSARSPPSGFGDHYGSPTQYPHPVPYYPSRRSSAPTDRAPAPLTSIPSVSSSGDSHGHASSIDGYSTAHTTPIDPAEATPGRMLPPPPGMIMAPGYKCDAPECTAPPFQTQYLLRFVMCCHPGPLYY
jgi:hypothetical protein